MWPSFSGPNRRAGCSGAPMVDRPRHRLVSSPSRLRPVDRPARARRSVGTCPDRNCWYRSGQVREQKRAAAGEATALVPWVARVGSRTRPDNRLRAASGIAGSDTATSVATLPRTVTAARTGRRSHPGPCAAGPAGPTIRGAPRSARRSPQEAAVPLRTATAAPADVLDERALEHLDNRELDLLFRSSPAGPVPHGRLPGTALLFPGKWVCGVLARLTYLLFWRGEGTHPPARPPENPVGPLRGRAIKALLSHHHSW